jgi:hypothetical protein
MKSLMLSAGSLSMLVSYSCVRRLQPRASLPSARPFHTTTTASLIYLVEKLVTRFKLRNIAAFQQVFE